MQFGKALEISNIRVQGFIATSSGNYLSGSPLESRVDDTCRMGHNLFSTNQAWVPCNWYR
ncbi:hypothetical protein HHK36_016331 [Tetracentron sinense]|uniref:Uncharacterized protein n=1 Tax=Tetracentron sinense TaxID=13715 RepID=A0A834YZG4_TETSI|nr:hypothetical protein HHK36_016331 [Tetracentron sinense]